MDNQIEPRDEQPRDRKVLLLAGGALALVGGLALAAAIMVRDDGSSRAPPASQGGLVVQATKPDEDARLDPSRPLRCFVSGQFVGELTLAECAKRNGVATGALDVGLDETGALGAADVFGTVLTPLPPEDVEPSVTVSTPPAPSAAPTPLAACLRYSRGGWQELGEMSRGACVQTLFAGQCEGRGDAAYGRWGEQTLRLVTGRVEVSPDNRGFRTLVEQGPGCSLPSVE
jgi:hypothetical protein